MIFHKNLSSSLFPICTLFVLITCFFVPVLAASQGPELVITNITGKGTAFPGYPYEGKITIENKGDQTSGITSVIMFFKSPDETGENGTISSGPLDPIRPGQIITLPYIGTVPVDLAPGEYRLYGYLKATGYRDPDKAGTIGRLPSLVSVQKKPLPNQSLLDQGIVRAIQYGTNENRQNEGLTPLTWDDNLATIAAAYAEELSLTGDLSHTDKSGDGPAERAESFGYPTTKEIDGGIRIGISENLAYIGTGMVAGVGYVDPTNSSAIADALMDGWMKSPGHRKNILDPQSDRFGVGIFWNGEYYYAVSEFW